MLQCASPAGHTGTEVSLIATLCYSAHTSYTNPCLDAILVVWGVFLYHFLTHFEGFLAFFGTAKVGDCQSTNGHKVKFPLTKSGLPSSKCERTKASAIFFSKLNFYKQSAVAGSSSCSCLGAVQSDEPNINDTPGLLLITCNSTDATFLPPQRITPCLQVTAILNFLDWLTRLSRFLH